MILSRQGVLRYLAPLFGLLVGLSCLEAQATTFTVRLRPGEPVTIHDFAVCAFGQDPKEGGMEFRKEPDFGQHPVMRGIFATDPATSRVVGFAVDIVEHKLYVDHNADRDLTDDPEGMYEAKPTGNGYWVAEHVPVRYGKPPRTYSVNFHFHTEDDEGSVSNVMVVSTWRGHVELGGRDYTIVAVPGVSELRDYQGNWFIQPAGEAFTTPSICRRTRKFLPGHRMFIAGKAYDMSFRYVPAGDNCDIEGTLNETSVPLGSIRIVGDNVRALSMGLDRPAIPVYVDPAELVALVPVGDYSSVSSDLELRPGQIRSFDWHFGRYRNLVVRPVGETALYVGGPLSQSILPRHDGPDLRVVHRITSSGGVEGEKSLTLSKLDDVDPELRILRHGQLLTTTSMSYG